MFQVSKQERAPRRMAPMIACTIALAAFVAIARPAAAQECTDGNEGGNIVCGFVWSDTNGDGIQNEINSGLEGFKVEISNGTDIVASTYTDTNGIYMIDSMQIPVGTYMVIVTPPTGSSLTPTVSNSGEVGGIDVLDDSDGTANLGSSVYFPLEIVDSSTAHDIDFGFTSTGAKNPGTGTPGYWKNHPEAWSATPYSSSITVGGVTYSKDEAIMWLGKVGKDKRTTMFSSLVPAMLNVSIGNDATCVADTIKAANDWMAAQPSLKTNPTSIVPASSPAWVVGEPLHMFLDSYNNGHECAPHRK